MTYALEVEVVVWSIFRFEKCMPHDGGIISTAGQNIRGYCVVYMNYSRTIYLWVVDGRSWRFRGGKTRATLILVFTTALVTSSCARIIRIYILGIF